MLVIVAILSRLANAAFVAARQRRLFPEQRVVVDRAGRIVETHEGELLPLPVSVCAPELGRLRPYTCQRSYDQRRMIAPHGIAR